MLHNHFHKGTRGTTILSSIFRPELQWIRFGNRKFALSDLCARLTAIYRRENRANFSTVGVYRRKTPVGSLVYSTSCTRQRRASRIARSETYRNALQSARSREYGGRMPRTHLQSHRLALVTAFKFSKSVKEHVRENDVASSSSVTIFMPFQVHRWNF